MASLLEILEVSHCPDLHQKHSFVDVQLGVIKGAYYDIDLKQLFRIAIFIRINIEYLKSYGIVDRQAIIKNNLLYYERFDAPSF